MIITIPKSDVELQLAITELHLRYYPEKKKSEFISELFFAGVEALKAKALAGSAEPTTAQVRKAKPKVQA